MLEISKPVVVTAVGRDNDLAPNAVAATPGLQPNVIVKVIQPFTIVVVRAARTFLQVLVGLLTAGGIGLGSGVLPAGDFMMLLKVSASLALAPTIVSVIQNLIELLTRLDQSAPTLRA